MNHDADNPIQKRGGHQPAASGPSPTKPPPKPEDALRSVVSPETYERIMALRRG